MNDVGVDPVCECHAGHGRAGDLAFGHDLGFEFWGVIATLGTLGDRFVRHDVHDLHRAHDASALGLSQDGIAGRLPFTFTLLPDS